MKPTRGKSTFFGPMANALMHSAAQNAFAKPSSMTNALAGSNAAGFRSRLDPSMFRLDGSQKGRGYLGPVQNPYGQTMTEYTIGVNMDGKEVEIPTFVPTLTPQELEYLTRIEDGQPIPESIVQKAVDHARMRMQQDLSPFHDSGPNHTKRQY